MFFESKESVMTKGIALVTDHMGTGSFVKVPYADNDEFLTGQWPISADVGDELALLQRYGNAQHSFAAGRIVYVIASGKTEGDQPRNRYTYLVQLNRELCVKREVFFGENRKLVRVGRHYDDNGEQYCDRI